MKASLEKQYIYEEKTGAGVHYVFNSKGKDVRLADIYNALKKHHKGLSQEEKRMIRDLCLMLNDGTIEGEDSRAQILRFTIGYLFGKYAINTDMKISAENVTITDRELNDSAGQSKYDP